MPSKPKKPPVTKKAVAEKPEASKWQEKIDRALKVRKDWKARFRVDLAKAYWEGQQQPPGTNSDEWITINMIFSILQSELPTLYATDPWYYINLKQSFSPHPMDIAMYEMKARVRQAYLNYLKGELKLKIKARLSILDAHFSYGVLKTVYAADLVENPDAGKPIKSDKSDKFLKNNVGESINEPNYLPTNGKYKILRIHPDDFLVDEDAGPLDEDVSWKAHRFTEKLDDVKNNRRYRQEARNIVKATAISDNEFLDREKKKKGVLEKSTEPQADLVVIWEIYDIKKRQVLTIAEGCPEYLVEPGDLPPGIENDPFEDLRFILRDDSWYPLPPASQWIDPQKDYCEARSKLKTHRKRFNRKYQAFTQGLESDTELTKLETGEDGTIIKTIQPVDCVRAIQDAPLDQQLHVEIGYLRQDFQDVAIGSNQRGSGAGVDSATEAGILEKRTMLREGDKVGIVLDFLVETGRKLDQLVQANITQDMAVKVSGIQGEYWELIKTTDYDEISGEYEYSIDVGNSTPHLPEIERAQWNAFLGLIANAPQLALSRSLLKKTAEMHHIYDETMIDELMNIAKAMMQGQIPMAGKVGSAPGVTQQNPNAMGPGAAMGMSNIRGGMQ